MRQEKALRDLETLTREKKNYARGILNSETLLTV